MSFQFSKRSMDNLKLVHPKLAVVTHKALEMGVVDFTVTAGVRTQEQQDALYAQGRTAPGPIVTNTRKSNHLIQKDGFGHAVDLHPFPINYADIERYKMLAVVMFRAAMEHEVQISWGGFWKNPDWPHFQLT